MLKEYLVSLLSAPLADRSLTRLLADKSAQELVSALLSWVEHLPEGNPLVRIEASAQNGKVLLRLDQPCQGRASVRLISGSEVHIGARELLAMAIKESKSDNSDVFILAICADEADPRVGALLEDLWREMDSIAGGILMEPAWCAAILIEQIQPLCQPVGELGSTYAAPAYFQPRLSTDASIVAIRRASTRLRHFAGRVVANGGAYDERVRELSTEEPYDGTILLCTVFLNPVTFSRSAVHRFYHGVGATEERKHLVTEKMEWEHRLWTAHIEGHSRLEIYDRRAIEEYMAEPEYYQMPLTIRELKEQVGNLEKLLSHANYTLCLAPEAVALGFELRGDEVRIRTDRRNKGQSRVGRINGLVLQDPAVAQVFEREFWNLFRNTEDKFKDKSFILRWFKERARGYQGVGVRGTSGVSPFDVFLCHNSEDKPAVKKIATRLVKEGVRPWFDEWHMVPGRPWQRQLEAQIGQVRAAAVFVGRSGLGPWSHMELDAFIREFISRQCPVIPILLPGVRRVPDLPVFLRGMHWVDFRRRQPSPLRELVRSLK